MNVSFLLFCKTVRPMLSNRFMSCLSVCNVGVLLPNGSMDTMPLDTDVGFGHGYILLDGDPAPPAAAPLFVPCLLWLRSPISATAELLLMIVHLPSFVYC